MRGMLRRRSPRDLRLGAAFTRPAQTRMLADGPYTPTRGPAAAADCDAGARVACARAASGEDRARDMARGDGSASSHAPSKSTTAPCQNSSVAENSIHGKFITLEGVDGAGKSSHVEGIAALLRARGRRVRVTREPGGTPLAEKLRALVLAEPMDPLSETLLMFAARDDHLRRVIVPALTEALCLVHHSRRDRRIPGGGGRIRGPDRSAARRSTDLEPDLTLISLPVRVCAERRTDGKALYRSSVKDGVFRTRARGLSDLSAARPPDAGDRCRGHSSLIRKT